MINICIGLAVLLIIQWIKPTKMEVKGFFGIVIFALALWGIGAVVNMTYQAILK